MKRILVVDNDPRDRQRFKTLLEKSGYEVLVASDINTARKALENEPFHLAIVDVRLKDDEDSDDVSGLDLAATHREIPKIILTEYPTGYPIRASELEIRLPLASENVAFFFKGKNPKDLLTTIDDLLSQAKSQVTFSLLESGQSSSPRLTSGYLKRVVTPYLNAVSELQAVLNRMLNREPSEMWIQAISQNSPISVSLQGALEATDVIRELVTPWRREHAQKMALLEQQEKIVQIEVHKAEIHEKRMQAQKDRTEIRKAELDAEKSRAEIDKLNLENERLRIEIQEKRIELALKVVERFSPHISEPQRINFLIQILEPLGVVTNSPLQIGDATD